MSTTFASPALEIERITRGVCFFVHFGIHALLVVLDAIFHYLIPSLALAVDAYFIETHKVRSPTEYLIKTFASGLFKVFGIRLITEFKVRICIHIQNCFRPKFQKT
jgi:hypothetical protein